MPAPQFPLMAQKRHVLLHRDEEGWWIADCPSLPGCVTQGKTKASAITNIKDAIQGYIAALEADGLPVPPETYEAALVAVP